jgi:DNA-binding transcriptional regulator YdaS (Cro superfamily)
MRETPEGQLLETVDEVIDAVGGTFDAAKLAGIKPPGVSNWRSRGRIPPDKSMIFAEALRLVGKTARPEVFGLEPAEARI